MEPLQVQVSTPNPEASQNTQNAPNPDIDMNGAPSAVDNADGQPNEDADITLLDVQPTEPEPESSGQMEPPKKSPGLRFLDFLTSPIVEISVGQGENSTLLTAHQSVLLESPFLAEFVEGFEQLGNRRIELPNENVEAFGSFLQFQYTHDYSSQTQAADQDAAGEPDDDSGELLLKHARVYTLAEKLGLPALKTLAHSKIHRINSTSRGEIAYARYVYTHTPSDDTTIRKPVASFWAQRSHVLRHEANDEFRKLCIEVPEFAWDMLTIVLDQKEKRAQDRAENESGVKGSGRKRLRSGL